MESHQALPSSTRPDCMFEAYVYQFRIEVLGISPPIWRRIQVPSGYRFFALHSAIQDVMGWTTQHGYCFRSFNRVPAITSIGSPSNGSAPLSEQDLPIKICFEIEGDTASYVYQHWRFRIVFELKARTVEGVNYPVCVCGQRGSPPESICCAKRFQHYSIQMAADPDRDNPLSSMGFSDRFDPREVVFYNPLLRFQLAL